LQRFYATETSEYQIHTKFSYAETREIFEVSDENELLCSFEVSFSDFETSEVRGGLFRKKSVLLISLQYEQR
jgi:hypothetical protein